MKFQNLQKLKKFSGAVGQNINTRAAILLCRIINNNILYYTVLTCV